MLFFRVIIEIDLFITYTYILLYFNIYQLFIKFYIHYIWNTITIPISEIFIILFFIESSNYSI